MPSLLGGVVLCNLVCSCSIELNTFLFQQLYSCKLVKKFCMLSDSTWYCSKLENLFVM